MKKSQIITNRRVRTNSDGINCYLMRTVVNIEEDDNGNRVYIARTDYVDKRIVDEIKLDDSGMPVELDNGEYETVEVEKFVNLGKVDSESEFPVANNQVNSMFSQIKPLINIQELLINNSNLFEFETRLKSIMLLADTKNQASKNNFYETTADDWVLLVDDI